MRPSKGDTPQALASRPHSLMKRSSISRRGAELAAMFQSIPNGSIVTERDCRVRFLTTSPMLGHGSSGHVARALSAARHVPLFRGFVHIFKTKAQPGTADPSGRLW